MKKVLCVLGVLILTALWSMPVTAIELVRQKNVATILYFPIIDDTGATVVAAAGLDSEYDYWTDAAPADGFEDLTAEATDINAAGWYSLAVSQAEMNHDYIAIKVYSSTAGSLDTRILIRTIVGDPLNLATSDDGGAINVTAGKIDTVTTTTTATTCGTVNALAANVITAASINADAITEAKIADNAIAAEHLNATAVTKIIDDFETQSQADPTGFHVNVKEVNGTAQTANDNGADINAVLVDTADMQPRVVAIEVDTNELQSDDYPTSIAAIKAETALIVADTNELQSDDYPTSIAAIKAETAAILVDTAEIGAAGVGLTEAGGDGDHLTAINLPNQTMNITGNLSGTVGSVTGAVGSVTGAVGSVTGAVGSVTGAVGSVTGSVGSVAGNVDGSVATCAAATVSAIDDIDFGATMKASINTEVKDVIVTDTYAEIAAGAPSATPTFAYMMTAIYEYLLRNRLLVTSTLVTLYKDDGTTPVFKATVGDDGTTFTRSEFVAP